MEATTSSLEREQRFDVSMTRSTSTCCVSYVDACTLRTPMTSSETSCSSRGAVRNAIDQGAIALSVLDGLTAPEPAIVLNISPPMNQPTHHGIP